MRKAFRKNWGPKVLSLILATGIWIIVHKDLVANGQWDWQDRQPPRAKPAPKDTQMRDIEDRLSKLRDQLRSQIELIERQQKILEEERLQQQEEPEPEPVVEEPEKTESK